MVAIHHSHSTATDASMIDISVFPTNDNSIQTAIEEAVARMEARVERRLLSTLNVDNLERAQTVTEDNLSRLEDRLVQKVLSSLPSMTRQAADPVSQFVGVAKQEVGSPSDMQNQEDVAVLRKIFPWVAENILGEIAEGQLPYSHLHLLEPPSRRAPLTIDKAGIHSLRQFTACWMTYAAICTHVPSLFRRQILLGDLAFLLAQVSDLSMHMDWHDVAHDVKLLCNIFWTKNSLRSDSASQTMHDSRFSVEVEIDQTEHLHDAISTWLHAQDAFSHGAESAEGVKFGLEAHIAEMKQATELGIIPTKRNIFLNDEDSSSSISSTRWVPCLPMKRSTWISQEPLQETGPILVGMEQLQQGSVPRSSYLPSPILRSQTPFKRLSPTSPPAKGSQRNTYGGLFDLSQIPARAPPSLSSPTQCDSDIRRQSVQGQGIPVEDAVSVTSGNVQAVKQGSAVTLGTIDDAPTPLSLSPVVAPPPVTVHDIAKVFGSVPANVVKHKITSPSLSTGSRYATTTPPTSSKPKVDIRKLFQSVSSTSPSDASAPVCSSPVSLQQRQPHDPPPLNHLFQDNAIIPNWIPPAQHHHTHNGQPAPPPLGMKMSSWNPPPPLRRSPSPPAPLSNITSLPQSARLNTNASTFVPRPRRRAVTIKTEAGQEVDISGLKPSIGINSPFGPPSATTNGESYDKMDARRSFVWL